MVTRALAALVQAAAIVAPLTAQRPVPLQIVVAHPAANAAVDVEDSIFLYGTVSDPKATLTVGGQPVTLAPNGAWLAWIGVPHDSLLAIPLQARRGSDRKSLILTLRRLHWTSEHGAWVDRSSMTPTGAVTVVGDEPVPLLVRAAPGATVRLLLPGQLPRLFAHDSSLRQVPAGIRAFDRDDRNLRRAPATDQYVAVLRREQWGAGAGLLDSSSVDSSAILEVITGTDTTRTPWPLSLHRLMSPISVVLDGDPANRGDADPTTPGRATPSGTYAWFFPLGTRTQADSRVGNQVRLRLAHDEIAWVPFASVRVAPVADDSRTAVLGALAAQHDSGVTRIRLPLTVRTPFRVTENGDGLAIELFNTVADANWTRFGTAVSQLRTLTWQQQSSDRVVVNIGLHEPLYGWRAHFDGNDLLVELRNAPHVDPLHPLSGRVIAIDAGHPPAGACGPTAYCEPEANLAVATLVRDALLATGSTVVMTRENGDSLGLWRRVQRADLAEVDLLVSIHHNGMPDGVNPMANFGVSTFFNQPLAQSLAATVQRALVSAIGGRDLGIARGDLALTRPTWYPAVLTEGFSLTIPEQEITARSPAGRAAYANGIVAAITSWFTELSAGLRSQR